MKIKKITIKNFKSIKDLEFEFNDTIYSLVGKNGRGKTAFKEAFYAAITGDFPDDCIANGSDFCSVTITLESGTEIGRFVNKSKANKVTIDGKTSTLKVVDEVLLREAGISKDILKLVIATDPLQQLKPSEFSRFITPYIKDELDFQKLCEYLPTNITSAQKDKLKSMLPAYPNKFNLQTLINTYTKAVDERKIAKREFATLSAAVLSYKGGTPSRDLKEIDLELEELFRKQGAQTEIKKSKQNYEIAVNNRQKIINQLKTIKEQVENNKSTKPEPAKLQEIKTKKNNAINTISQLNSAISVCKNNNQIHNKMLDSLNKPVCPINPKLVCTTDKTPLKEELLKQIKENEEAISKNQGIIQELEFEIKNLEGQEMEYRNNEIAYNNKVHLVNTYNDLRSKIPELPAKPDDVEIINYSADIDKLKIERNNVIAYQQYLKNIEAKDRKQTEVEILEVLCTVLNTKGDVMNTIITAYLSVFKGATDITSNNLRKGFEFKFIADGGISYLVRPSENKEFVTLDSLSSGEQLLALFVLLNMFNSLTNSRIMLLDNLDKLDRDAFEELLKLLNKPFIKDNYDHIILCAVDHEDVKEMMFNEGIKNIY